MGRNQPKRSLACEARGLVPDRKCHDCGKPTWNYRCEACQRLWRAKHDVCLDYDCDNDEFTINEVLKHGQHYGS